MKCRAGTQKAIITFTSAISNILKLDRPLYNGLARGGEDGWAVGYVYSTKSTGKSLKDVCCQ